jgi:hypothetical protein
MGDLGE